MFGRVDASSGWRGCLSARQLSLLEGDASLERLSSTELSEAHQDFVGHAQYYADEYGPLEDGKGKVLVACRGDRIGMWVCVWPAVDAAGRAGVSNTGWVYLWESLEHETGDKLVMVFLAVDRHGKKCVLSHNSACPASGRALLKRIPVGHYVLVGRLEGEFQKLTEEKVKRLVTREQLQEGCHDTKDWALTVEEGWEICMSEVSYTVDLTFVKGCGGHWMSVGPMKEDGLEEADREGKWGEIYDFVAQKGMGDTGVGIVSFHCTKLGVPRVLHWGEERPEKLEGLAMLALSQVGVM